ncbi:hypothetical protein AMTRI_Chr08g166560 [Amborella trichopoda]|uniref:RING-type E3 ubiquitin transferase n=1 Tax=Amborella trichopoda TaxID=13333 RepID=W1PC12_AMBTC|nr:RING-H2 finger protein ATL66 [Amborella trichopoda]ERN05219.1 hypothetical protein AMTR_s00007p00056710 [Amborella trichopoda]|eukprot:XP_006843544.1 RING-H2 finger protein ATL66 [Amborella trichopoda]
MASSSSSQTTTPLHWHYADLDDSNFEVHGRSLLFVIVLFSVILLFTLICLYARWVYKYTVNRQHSASASPPAAPPPPIPQPSDRPAAAGLNPVAISGLPVSLYKGQAVSPPDALQCSICLSAFVEDEKVKILPTCHHTFHTECVDRWLRTQSSCPLCRASLLSSPADKLDPGSAV